MMSKANKTNGLEFSSSSLIMSPSLCMCRVAEEVIFGTENVTTGASSDFMQVSRVARQMVERFGFSKKIGQVAIGGGGGNPFLGQQVLPPATYMSKMSFCYFIIDLCTLVIADVIPERLLHGNSRCCGCRSERTCREGIRKGH